jgi:alpha-mannosidase
MDDASVTTAADRLNHQVKVVSTDIHKGALPRQAMLASISPANVILSGFKKAEDNDAVIVRVYESEGRKTDCVVTLNESILGKVSSVAELDMMERPIKSNVRSADNSVTVTVPAYGITSLRISITHS